MKHAVHEQVHLNLEHHHLHKLAHGHRVQLEHHHLTGGRHHIVVHHETAKKIHAAHRAHKGVRIGPLSHEEIMSSGSLKSIWESVKSGFNKYVKPVLSGVGDALAYANPELAPLREGVRAISGVGIKHHKKAHHAATLTKGSEAARERMARVRAAKGPAHPKKKHHEGGSFLLY